ncbi:MAG: hypothetical protein OWU33_05075 [Firmicutes bacterium]|nr:hypothetical protein [Bacillota bacterium]
MDQCITTLLTLDGWEVMGVEATATGWRLTVDAPRPTGCGHCGHLTLHRHGT